MATYLNRTPSSASNRKTWTYSTWLKRSQLSAGNAFFAAGAGTVEFTAYFVNNDTLEVYQYDSGTYRFRYITNQVFRDPSAWYHIVIACDTTQGSASDRVKIYVNGSQITSFSNNTTPSQNQDTSVNLNTPHVLGRYHTSASGYYLGYMAQTILVDGTALTPSTFGSTNANGIWVPNTGPSITYGTNGFNLAFAGTGTTADASGFGADSSGNGNHFTANSLGTNPSTTDTTQNNFATLNPLDARQGATYSKGLLEVVTSSSNRNYSTMTQTTQSGKWYLECKFTAGASSGYVGFCDMSDLQMTGTSTLGDLPNEARVNNDGSYEKNNSTTSGWAGSFTDNDILGLALDCDNNRFTLSKNGQWADGSGNYDEANPTAYITYTAGNFMSFAFGEGAGGATATIQVNAGQPIFTIASSNADADGYGNFEYAVPSGYYALCTKNLAAYGG